MLPEDQMRHQIENSQCGLEREGLGGDRACLGVVMGMTEGGGSVRLWRVFRRAGDRAVI